MDFLKTLWPTPFKIKKGDLMSFLVQLIIFLVITAVMGVLIGFLSGIAIIGVVFTIVGYLLGLYSLIGVVLCILKFLAVI